MVLAVLDAEVSLARLSGACCCKRCSLHNVFWIVVCLRCLGSAGAATTCDSTDADRLRVTGMPCELEWEKIGASVRA